LLAAGKLVLVPERSFNPGKRSSTVCICQREALRWAMVRFSGR